MEQQVHCVCGVMVSLAEQMKQGVGMPTRVTAVRSLLHVVNTFINDPYIQVLLARQQSLGESSSRTDDAGENIPRALEKCFLLTLATLVPPTPSTLSSPLLKKEFLLALGTLAKHLSGNFLLIELSKILDLYTRTHDDFIRCVSSEKEEAQKTVVEEGVESDITTSTNTSSSDHTNSSGSGSNVPIVAAASFNQAASSSEFALGVGGGGGAEVVIAIAEVMRSVLERAGDTALQQVGQSL